MQVHSRTETISQVFAGAVAVDSPSPGPALAFLKFLRDPAKRDHWEAAGFEPAGSLPA